MERRDELERMKGVLNTDGGRLLMDDLRKECCPDRIASKDMADTLMLAAKRDVYRLLEMYQNGELLNE